MDELTIDPEFRDLLGTPDATSLELLQESLLEEGCREPIIVWANHEDTIIDGHNRYSICQRLGIPFKITPLTFKTRQDVLRWIYTNQAARRNLTPQQLSYIRGKAYLERKQDVRNAAGRNQHSVVSGNNCHKPRGSAATAHEVAAEFGVSERTVRYDAEFAKQVDDAPPERREELLKKRPHVSHNSGNNEWYTPAEYLEAARQAMGSIDTDPASSEAANEKVQAQVFYTAEHDGLIRPWQGNVWLNPPYSSGLVDRFIERLLEAMQDKEAKQAVLLVNNATDTSWFQKAAKACRAICFPAGRVKFWQPGGNIGSPLQGQALLYFGSQDGLFCDAFGKFGFVIRK